MFFGGRPFQHRGTQTAPQATRNRLLRIIDVIPVYNCRSKVLQFLWPQHSFPAKTGSKTPPASGPLVGGGLELAKAAQTPKIDDSRSAPRPILTKDTLRIRTHIRRSDSSTSGPWAGLLGLVCWPVSAGKLTRRYQDPVPKCIGLRPEWV